MSGSLLGGSSGVGIGIDPNGQMVRIDTGTLTSTSFTLTAADSVHARWDLLVLEYVKTGDTLIPKPSDPLTNTDLNLHDDFLLKVITGTPSATPSYPVKGANDIILAGIKVPANATLGSSCTVDLSVREIANSSSTSGNFIATDPLVYEQIHQLDAYLSSLGLQQGKLIPTGNPSVWNTPWVLPNGGPLLVFLDGADEFMTDDWTYSIVSGVGTVTFNTPVASGQTPYGAALTNAGANAGVGQIFEQGKLMATLDPTKWILPFTPSAQSNLLIFNDGEFMFYSSEWTWALESGLPVVTFVTAPAAGVTPFAVSLAFGVGGGGGGGGGGGSALPEVHGSELIPIGINPTVGITPTSAPDQVWWIAPSLGTGQVPITESPPIAPGSAIGQRLTLISVAAANYLTINPGSGVTQTGPVNFGPSFAQVAVYMWGGNSWILVSTAV